MNLVNIIIILIALYFFKNLTIKKTPFSVQKSSEVEVCPPHFVYGALNNKKLNIIFVNVLSDKLKYKIKLNGFNDSRSLSKKEFENLLNRNNNQIPDSISKVVLYCASWSCSGAKNYYKRS